jgi:hypothetical protein
LAEQLTLNQLVLGSSPSRGTKLHWKMRAEEGDTNKSFSAISRTEQVSNKMRQMILRIIERLCVQLSLS